MLTVGVKDNLLPFFSPHWKLASNLRITEILRRHGSGSPRLPRSDAVRFGHTLRCSDDQQHDADGQPGGVGQTNLTTQSSHIRELADWKPDLESRLDKLQDAVIDLQSAHSPSPSVAGGPSPLPQAHMTRRSTGGVTAASSTTLEGCRR